ncbi:hypothetical protein PENTCL1PPCAC_6359 [Pristionchus entomophagus]|uniref:Uncharacterized protein n=1 Tax=Pristionchus entomophagus TaxID=358040 RepID=A0AAV5SMP5_9BILA|nr:hypothetical protein PENTCL1PPCAC_6359 [Pristionchus entomophagus]
MHVSYSFFAHLANFDFNRSVPSSISKKLTPSTPSKQAKSGKKDEGKSPISSTARSTPRSRHSSTKRILIKKPVEYSNPSVPSSSSDSVDVAVCH